MTRRLLIVLGASLSLSLQLRAQPLAERLTRAWARFEADSQLRAGIASLYVAEVESGKVLFERNAHTGLAPASTQKVITAASAYDILGPDFHFETKLVAQGLLVKDTLKGSLWLYGGGDPTLGSFRWQQTVPSAVLGRFAAAMRKKGIRWYDATGAGSPGWEGEGIPDGWTWQDIGQYYGAGAWGLNWRENQLEVKLQPGASEGEPARVTERLPVVVNVQLRTGAAGSGDNSYFYFNPTGGYMLRGSIGAGKPVTVTGALFDPAAILQRELGEALSKEGIRPVPYNASQLQPQRLDTMLTLHTEQSPPLDSISFWFLRKSVNLYGEALLKAMALQRKGIADTRTGVGLLRELWAERGIDPVELGIRDGSGLSPESRVTTAAQVAVLRWAYTQPWYKSYFAGFPTYNDMRMKSGTISAVKGFCGYHTAKDGKEYVFSFLVNNYNGSTNAIVRKMYTVLDELK